MLRVRWCNIIVLNVRAPCEKKVMIQNTVFIRNYSTCSIIFPKYNITILLGYINAKIARKDIFKQTIGNKALHQVTKDNGVRILKLRHIKISGCYEHDIPARNIHTYTWTSRDGKIHNQIDQVLTDKKWHSYMLKVRSFREADCDTDRCLVVAKVRKRLEVNKQGAQMFDVERFNLRKLSDFWTKGSRLKCSGYRI